MDTNKKKILVVRFRQMGDAILTTPLLNTIRKSFPDARIDFVLNERLASLFKGHPAISNIITFTDEERHNTLTYIKKVRNTVKSTRYDAIIDMRSTPNTMLFALFSPGTPLRIGIRKPYTQGVFNHRMEACSDDENMIDHNLSLAAPLDIWGQLDLQRDLSLAISDEEKQQFRQKMEQAGIDFAKPVMLVGVTAKLRDKTWPDEYMAQTVKHLIKEYPGLQLIFNYAPDKEEENARRMYGQLGNPENIFINLTAQSPRELAAMAANCDAYFGNEGGTRHIVHAMGKPSLVICSPLASKKTWLPTATSIVARGISASDILPTKGLTPVEQYRLITPAHVLPQLRQFIADTLRL